MEYKHTDAVLSECGKYRYQLRRIWDDSKPSFFVIGLNPSTADGTQDDPTIRRCVGFANSNGCGSLIMGNLFAFRATNPADMKSAIDPVGRENDAWLRQMFYGSGIKVAAWGAHGDFLGRGNCVTDMLGNGLKCFGTTRSGQPKHPLYLRADSVLLTYPDYV